MTPDQLTVIGGGLATFLVLWGATRSMVGELRRKTVQLEKAHTALKDYATTNREQASEQLHALRDVYVSYAHFQEVMHTIKDTQRDLKESLDKIVDLLTKR